MWATFSYTKYFEPTKKIDDKENLKPLGHNGFEILKRQKRPVLSPLLGSNKKNVGATKTLNLLRRNAFRDFKRQNFSI